MSQSQSSLSLEKKTKKSLSVRNLAHAFSKDGLLTCFYSVIMFSLNTCRHYFVDRRLLFILIAVCSTCSSVVASAVITDVNRLKCSGVR